jgi:hypothetical protein
MAVSTVTTDNHASVSFSLELEPVGKQVFKKT